MQEDDEHIQASVARMQVVIELARTIRDRNSRPLKRPLLSLTVVHPDAGFLEDIATELRPYVMQAVIIITIDGDIYIYIHT